MMRKTLILVLLLPWPYGAVGVCPAQSIETPSLDRPVTILGSAQQSSCSCKKRSNKPHEHSGNSPEHQNPVPQGKEGDSKKPPQQSKCGLIGRSCRNTFWVVTDAKFSGTGVIRVPTSPNPPQPCDNQAKAEREGRVVLWRAQAASEDKDWENAQGLYAEAMKSCVPDIARKAHAEYNGVRLLSARWWWGTPVVTPILRRFVRYPWTSWIFFGLLLVFLAALLLWVLLLWLRFGEGDFSGEARLLLPSKLTEDGLPELFAAEIYRASQDVDECLKGASKDYFAGALNLVSAPYAELETLTDKLPEILGVSFGKWAGFFLAVPRYFSWRVETWQGFLKSGSDGQIRVRALLCRASDIYEKWDFTHAATDKFDIETSACALAARLKWQAIFRSGGDQTELTFAAPEGFCLFVEGLRALQKYGSESNRAKPQKERLDRFLGVALERLGQCAQEYPEDLLSRFYYGLALTVSNQALYVDRLYALRHSFTAWGNLLKLEGATGTADADSLSRRRLELAEQARQAQQLSAGDWSQLKQAAVVFDDLRSRTEGALKQAAAYNLAGVYGRLGGKNDIEKAREILDGFEPVESGPLRWVSGLFGRPREDESRALSLQASFEKDILDYWLAARRAVLADDNAPAAQEATKRNYEEASRNLDATVEKIRSSGLPENMRFDLEAELWCKRGYLQYEMATHIGSHTWLPGATSETHLETAKDHLEKALKLKPHWNPAQVYMALVLQLSGDINRANSYFQSLRGAEKTTNTASPAMAAD
jgi:hypothetical protein